MHSNISGFRTFLSVALAAAMCIATYTAIAQEKATQKTEEITVEAARPGQSKIGAPINTVTTKRTVRYGDLSLTTASGVAVLETRIRDAANAACTELDQKFPVASGGDSAQKCLNTAVDGGMADARKAIDVAKQKSPASYTAAVPVIQAREEITVEAARPGQSKIGAPINTVTTKRTVRYGDLSLTTASGVKVLENRIQEAARSACAELEQKHPLAAAGDTTQKCFDNAVKDAMVHAGKAVDAARVASNTR